MVNTTRRQQEETTASQSDVTVSQEAKVDRKREALVASHHRKEQNVIQISLYISLLIIPAVFNQTFTLFLP